MQSNHESLKEINNNNKNTNDKFTISSIPRSTTNKTYSSLTNQIKGDSDPHS